MNIYSETNTLFSAESLHLSDRVKTTQLNFVTTRKHFPSYHKILSYLQLFSDRDSIKISTTDPDDIPFYITKDCEEKDFLEFLTSGEETDDIEVIISIKKQIKNNRISVYCYKEFIKDLLKNTEFDFLNIIENLLQGCGYLIFEVFDTTISWHTRTLSFTSNSNSIFHSEINRLDILEKSKMISYNYSTLGKNALPDDFHIIEDYENNPLKPMFEKLETLLSLSYISSSFSIEDSGISGAIHGQRILQYKLNFNEIIYNPCLYQIYNWIYTDGNPADKAAISSNIISLQCRYKNLINLDKAALTTMISNYQLYLKENVDKYLELKNKISDFICNITNGISQDVSSIPTNFKNNIIALFGFLLSVVLVNIVSSQPLECIFTREITAIVEIVLLGSFVYFLISLIEVCNKYKKFKQNYDNLKANYADIFTKSEINQAFQDDSVFKEAKKSAKCGISIYSVLWFLFILLTFLFVEYISKMPLESPFISGH